MASDPKPTTGLEDFTSLDAERIILDMRGSPAEFWAKKMTSAFTTTEGCSSSSTTN